VLMVMFQFPSTAISALLRFVRKTGMVLEFHKAPAAV